MSVTPLVLSFEVALSELLLSELSLSIGFLSAVSSWLSSPEIVEEIFSLLLLLSTVVSLLSLSILSSAIWLLDLFLSLAFLGLLSLVSLKKELKPEKVDKLVSVFEWSSFDFSLICCTDLTVSAFTLWLFKPKNVKPSKTEAAPILSLRIEKWSCLSSNSIFLNLSW